ncbi:MAG: NTP transferase domain-containing protein [Verrucomicrobia bacterium]|nr:NTP transferase domain-containing protein [Verrucomicrobiota bacterium]MCF7709348.1 NTP transferase domain-containing protein [Verrucomicrobiota bacterium]
MKAVLLAAGKGTRMRELTEDVPKPMLKVNGRPILEHILLGLRAAGINDIFIVTGYRAEVVESYFGDGAGLGMRIAYGRQVVQNGTGKAPEPARAFVGNDPFLLSYGDILVKDETYQRMVEKYASDRFSGLLTVTPGAEIAKGGLVLFKDDLIFERLVEKPSDTEVERLRQAGHLCGDQKVWYNAGIYIFDPVIYRFIERLEKSSRGEYELTDAINAMSASGHALTGLEIPGRWVDVRDPEVLLELERNTF